MAEGKADQKSLRLQVAAIIGATNNSPEARALYMLVDHIEVLEGRITKLDRRPAGGDKIG